MVRIIKIIGPTTKVDDRVELINVLGIDEIIGMTNIVEKSEKSECW